MLKRGLLRVRVGSDSLLRPAFVSEKNREVLDRCQAVLDVFRSCVGSSRAMLEEQLNQLAAAGGDIKLNKGLIEVAGECAVFKEVPSKQAVEVRRILFEQGAAGFPVGTQEGRAREEVLRDAAALLGLTVESVESLMFSDLKEAQILERFDEEITPLWLLRRYNVALVQGILVHAVNLKITLQAPPPSRLRQLVRFLKFFRLLFTCSQEDSKVSLLVDGPLSVLEQTKAYGVRLAAFLPALLLLEEFQLCAELRWKRRRRFLYLSSDSGLVSHYADRGSWVPEELAILTRRLQELAPPGTTIEDASAVISLGGREVYVPDLVIASGGRRVMVEVVWPWRKLNWSRYYESFNAYAPRNALLYVPFRNIPRSFLESNRDQRIVYYRATPLADKLLARFREMIAMPQLWRG